MSKSKEFSLKIDDLIQHNIEDISQKEREKIQGGSGRFGVFGRFSGGGSVVGEFVDFNSYAAVLTTPTQQS